MPTKLQLYNEALLHCGERALASLTESREPRRLLDQVYSNGGVNWCLEQGQWAFAMRTSQVDYDSAIEPDFGFSRAFTKPDDYVLTSAVCSDEFFRSPLLSYSDEAGYWYADVDTIYVRYVSNDAAYGGSLANWPESFLEFAGLHFASKIVYRLTGDDKDQLRIEALRDRALKKAKGKSMAAGPTRFPARGSWVNARNRFPSGRDRGNSSGDLY